MAAPTRCGCLLAVLLVSAGTVRAQADEGIMATPGRPWSAVLPDPDRFNWDRTDRPGYRFRGMLPVHQRFHDYVRAKRQSPGGLSWADRMMVRRMQALRRWPEPPRPNQFWRAYLNYLRRQPTDDLNFAQRVMLSQLFARGLCPMDNPPGEHTQALVDYLNSGPFEARNWFERTFGRVAPWLEYEMASSGVDLTPGAAPSGVFPVDVSFNGLRIWYQVSGATVGAPKDQGGFTTTRTHAEGVLTADATLTVSGTYAVGGFGADITVIVWADDQRKEYKYYRVHETEPNSAPYSVSVTVPRHCKRGGFSVRLDGRYSMGGGHRGLVVSGTFRQSASDQAQEQSEEDAKWRAEVEKTLRDLGYEDTPTGRELKRMRAALAGGDAAWKAYVEAKQRELGYDQTPEGLEYQRLRQAMAAGGDVWNGYAQRGLGRAPLPPGAQAQADVGGLKVGTGASQGQVQGATDHFAQAPKVSCALEYRDLPPGTTVTAVWARDGKEVIRSERQCGGTGWVSFGISANQGNLAPGAYQVTVTAGGKVLGRKSFTIGQVSGGGDL